MFLVMEREKNTKRTDEKDPIRRKRTCLHTLSYWSRLLLEKSFQSCYQGGALETELANVLSLSVKSSVVCSIHMLIRAQPESLFQTLLLNSEQFICLLLRVYLQHVQNGSSLTSPNLYPYIQSLSDDTGHISLGFLSQKAESSASSFLSILKFPTDSAASLPVLHLCTLCTNSSHQHHQNCWSTSASLSCQSLLLGWVCHSQNYSSYPSVYIWPFKTRDSSLFTGEIVSIIWP